MRYQITVIIVFIFATVLLAGCPANETATENSKNTANSSPAQTDEGMGVQKTPEIETVNKAETITPVVQAYCDAMRKKDDAALMKVFSEETLRSYRADMKEENTASLSEFLNAFESVGSEPCEVRNEKIEGDKAVAEIKTFAYPNGVRRFFVKEGGEWKMTKDSPEFQSVKEAAK